MDIPPRFIVDQNVGKLARWLRLLGFDTLFFEGDDDREMVRLALDEGRTILTRDTHIGKRKVVTSGRLKVILLTSDRPEEQARQVVDSLSLKDSFRLFTLCIEDSYPLEAKSLEEVRGRVPPYVFKTQQQYMQCPHCRRIYWRGTHWLAMKKMLEKLSEC